MSVLDEMKATLVGSHEYPNSVKNEKAHKLQELKFAVFGFYKVLGNAMLLGGTWIKTDHGYNEHHRFFKCLRCGHVFVKSTDYMLINGHNRTACPKCSWNIVENKLRKIDNLKEKHRSSSGEIGVIEYLNNHNVKYTYGYICKHLIYKNHLHFDFWLPKYQIAIEYDGEQHFHPVKCWGGKKAFRIEKKRDHLKNRYCKKHHIKLIRIAYNQSIKEVLDNKLNRQLSLF